MKWKEEAYVINNLALRSKAGGCGTCGKGGDSAPTASRIMIWRQLETSTLHTDRLLTV